MLEQTIKCVVYDEEIIHVELIDGGSGSSTGLELSTILLRQDLTSQVTQGKTDFIVSNAYVTGSLKIWINGIKERLFTELSSTSFRLNPGVDSDDSVEVEYIKYES